MNDNSLQLNQMYREDLLRYANAERLARLARGNQPRNRRAARLLAPLGRALVALGSALLVASADSAQGPAAQSAPSWS